ncbi:MAG: hypothetical protein ACD_26C00059G0005 [uncultured bacterium]|nr:MAG: hypothetical protein ACD_26C00059G0005 [uncultured bacterium]
MHLSVIVKLLLSLLLGMVIGLERMGTQSLFSINRAFSIELIDFKISKRNRKLVRFIKNFLFFNNLIF